ncbi:hypothetical protein IWX48DRAFT_684003 [Phyllosticta citricarpa]
MSDDLVSPAVQQQMQQDNLENLLLLPFYPEPESHDQTSQLLLSLPRELRDMIWEWTARGMLRRGTHRRSSNNSLSAYLFLRESENDRPRNGRHGYTPYQRFGAVATSRQLRDEFVEALHRVAAFALKSLNYRNANFLGPLRPFALLDVRSIADLILDIPLQHENFAVLDTNPEKRKLAGPFSIKYTASGRLEDAQIVLSASWLTPPPPLVFSLAGMLEARTARGFPHRHDAGFGLQFDRLLDALAWRNRLRSFDVKLVLPPEIGAAPASTIDSQTGMIAFVSSLRRLRGVKRVVVEVYGHRLFSTDEIKVEEAFRQDFASSLTTLTTCKVSVR